MPAETTAIVYMDHVEGFQMALCVPPEGLPQAPPPACRRFVLDLAHGLVRFLAPLQEWDTAPLDALHERLAATDLLLRWETPWKSAPGRRHRARALFVMHADGFGRTQLEIQSRDGVLVARSEPATAFAVLPGWKRAAQTLHWDGAERVTYHPFVDLLGFSPEPSALTIKAGVAHPLSPTAAEELPANEVCEAPAWDVVVRRDPEEELPAVRDPAAPASSVGSQT